MRLFFLISIFYGNVLYSQSSIYDQQITTISGTKISMADYKGRKIVIASVSPASLQEKGSLIYWDSLQAANPKIVMILVPANDFDSITPPVALADIKNNLSDNIVLSVGVLVKKNKGSNQDPVMQWLTDSGKNSHFNQDIETDIQFFIISESGVLYAILSKGTLQKEIDDVLKQTEVKQQAIIPVDMKH